MTDDRRTRSDLGATWLAGGPARAPEHLLATVIDATSRVSQRPGWLARAGGAPGGGGRPRLVPDVRLAIALAMLLTALMVAATILVGTSPDEGLVVLPSRTPRPTPSAGPSRSPRPAPLDARVVERLDLGFSLTYDGQPWTTVRGTSLIGKCTLDFCPIVVRVVSGTPESGPLVASGIRVSGSTFDELEASWVDAFGPLTRATGSISVDGEPGIWLYSGTQRAVVVSHLNRVFALVDESLESLQGDRNLTNAVNAFRFLDPAPVVTPGPPTAYVWNDVGMMIPGGWTANDLPGRLTIRTSDLGPTISVTTAPVGNSMMLNDGNKPIMLGGDDLESLATSIEQQLSIGNRVALEIGGEPAYSWSVSRWTYTTLVRVVLVARGGRVFMFASYSGLTSDNGALDALLASVSFGR